MCMLRLMCCSVALELELEEAERERGGTRVQCEPFLRAGLGGVSFGMPVTIYGAVRIRRNSLSNEFKETSSITG